MSDVYDERSEAKLGGGKMMLLSSVHYKTRVVLPLISLGNHSNSADSFEGSVKSLLFIIIRKFEPSVKLPNKTRIVNTSTEG